MCRKIKEVEGWWVEEKVILIFFKFEEIFELGNVVFIIIIEVCILDLYYFDFLYFLMY